MPSTKAKSRHTTLFTLSRCTRRLPLAHATGVVDLDRIHDLATRRIDQRPTATMAIYWTGNGPKQLQATAYLLDSMLLLLLIHELHRPIYSDWKYAPPK